MKQFTFGIHAIVRHPPASLAITVVQTPFTAVPILNRAVNLLLGRLQPRRHPSFKWPPTSTLALCRCFTRQETPLRCNIRRLYSSSLTLVLLLACSPLNKMWTIITLFLLSVHNQQTPPVHHLQFSRLVGRMMVLISMPPSERRHLMLSYLSIA